MATLTPSLHGALVELAQLGSDLQAALRDGKGARFGALGRRFQALDPAECLFALRALHVQHLANPGELGLLPGFVPEPMSAGEL